MGPAWKAIVEWISRQPRSPPFTIPGGDAISQDLRVPTSWSAAVAWPASESPRFTRGNLLLSPFACALDDGVLWVGGSPFVTMTSKEYPQRSVFVLAPAEISGRSRPTLVWHYYAGDSPRPLIRPFAEVGSYLTVPAMRALRSPRPYKGRELVSTENLQWLAPSQPLAPLSSAALKVNILTTAACDAVPAARGVLSTMMLLSGASLWVASAARVFGDLRAFPLNPWPALAAESQFSDALKGLSGAMSMRDWMNQHAVTLAVALRTASLRAWILRTALFGLRGPPADSTGAPLAPAGLPLLAETKWTLVTGFFERSSSAPTAEEEAVVAGLLRALFVELKVDPRTMIELPYGVPPPQVSSVRSGDGVALIKPEALDLAVPAIGLVKELRGFRDAEAGSAAADAVSSAASSAPASASPSARSSAAASPEDGPDSMARTQRELLMSAT